LASTGILASLISMLFRRVEKLKKRLCNVELKNHLLCEVLGLDLSKIDPETEITKQLRIHLEKGDLDQARKLIRENIVEVEELKRVVKGAAR